MKQDRGAEDEMDDADKCDGGYYVLSPSVSLINDAMNVTVSDEGERDD